MEGAHENSKRGVVPRRAPPGPAVVPCHSAAREVPRGAARQSQPSAYLSSHLRPDPTRGGEEYTVQDSIFFVLHLECKTLFFRFL